MPKEDFSKQFEDVYPTTLHGLTKKNKGFIGANKGQNGLGVFGVALDFETAVPDHSSQDIQKDSTEEALKLQKKENFPVDHDDNEESGG